MKNVKEFYDVLRDKSESISSKMSPEECIKMGDLMHEYLRLGDYLPAQLTIEDIDNIIFDQQLQDLPMGDVQKWFKANYAGRYDGKLVSQVLKSLG